MLGMIFACTLLPIAGAVLSALAATWLRRGAAGWRARVGWDGALLLLVGAISNLVLVGWPGLPPHDVKFWPPFVAIAGLPVALMASSLGRWPLRIGAFLLLIGAASVVLLVPIYRGESAGTYAKLLSVVIFGWLATRALWSLSARSSSPGASLTALVVVSGASAGAMLLFGTITYAEAVGIIAFAMAVLAVMHWWGGMSRTGGESMVIALTILLPMWWVLVATMSDLPYWTIPLFILAGCSPWLSSLRPFNDMSDAKRILCVAVLALVVVAPALAWGVLESIRQAGHGGSEGY